MICHTGNSVMAWLLQPWPWTSQQWWVMFITREKWTWPATSPLPEDVDKKQQFVSRNESFESDPDATILNSDSCRVPFWTPASLRTVALWQPACWKKNYGRFVWPRHSSQMHSMHNKTVIMFLKDIIGGLEQNSRWNSININCSSVRREHWYW